MLPVQCKYRLGEGQGEAIYHIGVEDDGTVRGITPDQLKASLETLAAMAAEVGADTTVIRERDGLVGRVAEVLVRTRPIPGGHCVDLRYKTKTRGGERKPLSPINVLTRACSAQDCGRWKCRQR